MCNGSRVFHTLVIESIREFGGPQPPEEKCVAAEPLSAEGKGLGGLAIFGIYYQNISF